MQNGLSASDLGQNVGQRLKDKVKQNTRRERGHQKHVQKNILRKKKIGGVGAHGFPIEPAVLEPFVFLNVCCAILQVAESLA